MSRELVLPRPHARQLEVIAAAKRFNVLCCGRRWGKTTIAIDRIVHPALQGKRVAWFAPTYRLLGDPWRTLQDSFAPIIQRPNLAEHRLELVGGGVLECWSLDRADAGRGRAYHLIVVDEAALVMDLERAWEQTVRPMLTDYQGEAWFLSTPKGTANYFHTLYQRGQDPASPEWVSWRMPTSTNPFMPTAEIEAARGDLTDLAFAQEYLAEFVTWAGQVFRRIMDAVKPIDDSLPSMIGVDWGRTGDYTVFTAISNTGHVKATDRFRGIEYALQRDRLAAMFNRYGRSCDIIAEANAMGGPIIEQLQREGLPVIPFTTTAVSKPKLIQELALAFERGLIAIPNDPVLIGELQAFEGKPSPGGLMRYGAPAGLHDDCVMSLALAWAGLLRPKSQVRYIDPNSGRIVDELPEYRISDI